MKFDFELGESIKQQIEIINVALSRLHNSTFFENADVIVDKESAGTFQIIARLTRPDVNVLTVDFFLQDDGMRVDIENLPETFEWTSEEIWKKPSIISGFVFDLLRCYVVVERSNSGVWVKLFDAKGTRVDSMKVRSFGLFGKHDPANSNVHLFFPMYDLSKKANGTIES